MKRPGTSPKGADPAERDLESDLREAFTADDPEAAWYFDRAEERVVRVSRGATSVPDLPAEEVEEDDGRYVEIPAVTEGELHAWIEEFVEERPALAPLLDERHGANERFLERIASDPDALADWRRFHGRKLAETIAAWREMLGT